MDSSTSPDKDYFERKGSVSSLASRFEQLASLDGSSRSGIVNGRSANSSSTSTPAPTPPAVSLPATTAVPPKRPKPAGLRSNPSSSSTASTSSTLVGDSEDGKYDDRMISLADLNDPSNVAPLITSTLIDIVSPQQQQQQQRHGHLQAQFSLASQHPQEQQQADDVKQDASGSLGPPPIPHATRPTSVPPSTTTLLSPSPVPAFAYSISPPPSRQLDNATISSDGAVARAATTTTTTTTAATEEAEVVTPPTIASAPFRKVPEGLVRTETASTLAGPAYGAIASSSPSPRRSRTPPPIPASRRSRPNTPSGSLDVASKLLPDTMASAGGVVVATASPPQLDAPITTSSSDGPSRSDSPPHHHGLSVASLASRFGMPKAVSSGKSSNSSTRPASPSQQTPANGSPSSETTHTWHKGYDRSASKSASKALQEVTASSSSSSSSFLHKGKDENASAISEDSTPFQAVVAQSLPLTQLQSSVDARSIQRSRTPPPVPVTRPKSATNATSTPSSAYDQQSSSAAPQQPPTIIKTSPVPPALPARDRSNSTQLPAGKLVPPLPPPRPDSSAVDAISRPRSRTGPMSSPKKTLVQANGHGPHRRETAPAGSAESSESEHYVPLPPPTRNIQKDDSRASSPPTSERSLGVHGHQFPSHCADGTLDSSSASEDEDDNSDGKRQVNEMPDASFANRRPPKPSPERKIFPKHSVNAFAIHGRYAVSATTHLRIWDTWSGETSGIVTLQGEHKIVAVAFVFSQNDRSRDGTVVWAGTKDGKLFEVDIIAQQVMESKIGAHTHPISGIFRTDNNQVVTVCEAGKVQIWSNAAHPDAPPSLSSLPRTQRLGEKHTYVQCFGNQLWASHGPSRHTHISSSANKSPAIRIYDTTPESIFNLTPRAYYIPDGFCQVGCVMAGAVIPCQPNIVYLAHESGHISIWEKDSLRCVNVIRVSLYAVTAIAGVNDLLWIGNREGSIHVYDTSHTPWKVSKAWRASDEPVVGLEVDLATLASLDKLHVASYGRENLIMWDGLMQVDWLEHAMLKREQEFSTYRDIRVFICSWNIDSSKPADLQNDSRSINFLSDALQSSLTVEGDAPEVIVFGLQEVVDLEDKKVTAKSVLLGRKKADALFQDAVSHQYMRWHDRLVQAVRTAMPASTPYTLLHAENLVGLQSLIFVKTSEKPNISDAARVSVKTGMGGRYGNKGAILSRFVIDDSSICFTNCHLAAGQRATRQRNKDLINILENKSAFLQPSGAVPGVYVGGNGQTVFEHEICFLSGDLNYRIDLPRSVVTANVRSHNIKLLLEHDQLIKETKSNQSFRLRSFREADIDFLPTYKFDRGTDDYDSSAKERIPAWCDRILYRVHDPSLRQDHIKSIDYRSWGPTTSDHKPISGLFVVRVKKMDQDVRQKIWTQAEAAWAAREKDVLCDAKRFHGLCGE